MSTLKEHVAFIQNVINKGPRTDDARFSNRLIAHALKQARSRLIKIKLDKYDYISDSNYTKICTELQVVPIEECPCMDIPEQVCKITRSTCKIPKEIVSKFGSTIEVFTLDRSRIDPLSKTTNDYAAYSLTNNPPKKGWEIVDQYLDIYNAPKLKYAVIRLIPEDPEEAINFCGCGESSPCYSYSTDEFPIDAELVDPMYRLALELIGISEAYAEDNTPDARSVENLKSTDPNEP